MIPLRDVTALPQAVRAVRESSGKSRMALAALAGADLYRKAHTVGNQWSAWELGEKSPQLVSLVPYLHVHGLGLALRRLDGEDRSPWCAAMARDAHHTRCAMAAGHGGVHRMYSGKAFP